MRRGKPSVVDLCEYPEGNEDRVAIVVQQLRHRNLHHVVLTSWLRNLPKAQR